MKVKQEYQFWENVQKILSERKLSAVQLSQLSGVTPQTISHGMLRKSIPQLDNAYRIANALHIPLEYLMFGHQHEDDELDETLVLIKKSSRGSEIARYIPFLDSSQMSVIESLYRSWKMYDLFGNQEPRTK